MQTSSSLTKLITSFCQFVNLIICILFRKLDFISCKSFKIIWNVWIDIVNVLAWFTTFLFSCERVWLLYKMFKYIVKGYIHLHIYILFELIPFLSNRFQIIRKQFGLILSTPCYNWIAKVVSYSVLIAVYSYNLIIIPYSSICSKFHWFIQTYIRKKT